MTRNRSSPTGSSWTRNDPDQESGTGTFVVAPVPTSIVSTKGEPSQVPAVTSPPSSVHAMTYGAGPALDAATRFGAPPSAGTTQMTRSAALPCWIITATCDPSGDHVISNSSPSEPAWSSSTSLRSLLCTLANSTPRPGTNTANRSPTGAH